MTAKKWLEARVEYLMEALLARSKRVGELSQKLQDCSQALTITKQSLIVEAEKAERLEAELKHWKIAPPLETFTADELPEGIRGHQMLPDFQHLDPRAPIYAFKDRMEKRLGKQIQWASSGGGYDYRYPHKADWERFFEAIKPVILKSTRASNLCEARSFLAVGLAQQAGWENMTIGLISGDQLVAPSLGNPHAWAGIITPEGCFFQDFTFWQMVDADKDKRYIPSWMWIWP